MKHKIQTLHFIGIGGSGMSGIAEVLMNQGFCVQGSDLQGSAVTERLSSLGARVFVGHATEHIEGADAVVISSAVKPDNPELRAARAAKIPVVPRALMLSELMRMKQGIAIAGTHGKTTTTSLVASILAEGGQDPTFVIGGRLTSVGANARLGLGEAFVAEADESDGSFLNLMPMLAVITNIDADHMETYDHDLAKLKQAFIAFTQRLPFYGTAIVCLDDLGVREILPFISRPVITYGLHPEADVRAESLQADGLAMTFSLVREGRSPMPLRINLPGEHNVLNSLAAVCVALELGVRDESIARALSEFKGVGRRLQSWGEVTFPSGSVELIDDYGHHPAEIKATVAAVRGAFPNRRLVLVFQPHRFSRTRDLFEDFVRVLGAVDALILTEVYAAGEQPLPAADGRTLARAVRQRGKVEPIFVESIDEVADALDALVQPGDVVMTMGAGSIGGLPGLLAGRGRA
ncbi:MAG: UDP-N-acetylmuramate--L-alanine ligase [Betaproteobacteria bacterium]|nr:UDP-N-acetylmuramate--L-alanine ligase [Betaproteobacteria bacterium]NBY14577.1 UDP-N-acetylmuramate--L-alanine ligase [Betaproteobacteria bacterium]NCA15573.1 UDP-N-acetylmuramate--L-alanine ligase [Betaproteobacteria bacterium]